MKRTYALLLALALALPCAGIARAQGGMQPERPRRPQGIHFIYLVRHGMYDRDTSVTDDALGNGLNALGHQQARLAGRRLARLPVKLSALVCSNYLRARETAADMGRELRMTPVTDTLIHECGPRTDRPERSRDGTDEEVAACEANLNAAFAKYFTPSPAADRFDVLVCHGNVIRWMVTRALGADPRLWLHMDIANGSITAIAVRADGSMKLAAFSDSGHIPVEQQTWTGRGAGWEGARK